MKNKEIVYKEDYRQVSYDSMKSTFEIREQRRIRLFKLLFVLIIVIIIRGINGPFIINNPFGYTSTSNRYFEIKINNKPLDSSYMLHFKIPLIPFMLYFDSSFGSSYEYYEDYSLAPVFDHTKDVKLKLNTYECYYDGHRTTCNSWKDKTKKKKYHAKKMVIYKYDSEGDSKIVYKGKYKENIGKYIDSEGGYEVVIYGRFNLTKFETSAYVDFE